MTSVKQMKARMLPGHRQLLEAIRDGQKFSTPTDCEVRGYMKLRRTLSMWGAIDRDGLTDVGRELLA
jgi:hypothetical protein